jgi:hypothetical protein
MLACEIAALPSLTTTTLDKMKADPALLEEWAGNADCMQPEHRLPRLYWAPFLLRKR